MLKKLLADARYLFSFGQKREFLLHLKRLQSRYNTKIQGQNLYKIVAQN